MKGRGCSSAVGMNGGEQYLSLANGCVHTGKLAIATPQFMASRLGNFQLSEVVCSQCTASKAGILEVYSKYLDF